MVLKEGVTPARPVRKGLQALGSAFRLNKPSHLAIDEDRLRTGQRDHLKVDGQVLRVPPAPESAMPPVWDVVIVDLRGVLRGVDAGLFPCLHGVDFGPMNQMVFVPIPSNLIPCLFRPLLRDQATGKEDDVPVGSPAFLEFETPESRLHVVAKQTTQTHLERLQVLLVDFFIVCIFARDRQRDELVLPTHLRHLIGVNLRERRQSPLPRLVGKPAYNASRRLWGLFIGVGRTSK